MGTYKNGVLASLSTADLDRLAPHLVRVSLKKDQTLHEPGEAVDTIYFMEEGVCSIVVMMEDGATVEVGITGHEGFIGIPAILESGRSPNRTFIQIPGYGYALKAKILHEEAHPPRDYARCCSEYPGADGADRANGGLQSRA
jgi:CRP-like cAMP-binding protein